MQNEPLKIAVHGFQQRLESFKTKIELHQLLAQSLAAEFESITSEFESLKQRFGSSLHINESTSQNFESTPQNFESTPRNFESTTQNFESTTHNIESTPHNIESTTPSFESILSKFVATSYQRESLPPNHLSPSPQNESTAPNHSASSPINGDTSPLREMVSLIRRSLWESFKINYPQPNIPNRMALILRTLQKSQKITVAQLGQITGASRNSLVRDISLLKRLGWIKFNGSRRNGYFTLTASFPEI
jgi:hypothetical protein